MKIAGLHDNGYEFYFDDGEIYLLHSSNNFSWNNFSVEVMDLIKKAWNLPVNTSIRNHIKSYLNNENERLKEFVRIVWGELDHTPDITSEGEFNFENTEDYHLSEREKEFMKLVCQDLTDKEIADKMDIAYNTATTYRQNITNKIGVNSKIGIALFAFKNGIV